MIQGIVQRGSPAIEVPIAAVENLSVVDARYTDVTLSWDEVTCDKYQVKVCNKDSDYSETRSASKAEASKYFCGGLQAGTHYSFYVRGCCGESFGEWSNPLDVLTNYVPIPEMFFLKDVGATSVSFMWIKDISVKTEAPVKYQVKVKEKGTTMVRITDLDSSNSNHDDDDDNDVFVCDNLKSNTVYIFSMRISFEKITSEWSRGVVVTTLLGIPDAMKQLPEPGIFQYKDYSFGVVMRWVTNPRYPHEAIAYQISIDGGPKYLCGFGYFKCPDLERNRTYKVNIRAARGEGPWGPWRTFEVKIPQECSFETIDNDFIQPEEEEEIEDTVSAAYKVMPTLPFKMGND